MNRRPRLRPARTALALALAAALAHAAPSDPLSPERLAPIRAYIKKSWTTLTRSNADLVVAARDPKLPRPPEGPFPVYLSAKEDPARVDKVLAAVLPPAERRKIELRTLPAGPLALDRHGLLYLPQPYVVPGGRFNEMYGWDSYFILVGLLRDGEHERARDMVENFLYEIDHYGTILNANRTYFLSRSQPPFLSRMVLGVFGHNADRQWLRRVRPALEAYYRYWTTGEHRVPGQPLSRYWDSGEGPAPEVLSDEKDAQGRTHYDRVREYYRSHTVTDYDVSRYYDRARDELTPLFYKGDRSMRESGFDPSHRFGPFNVDIIHYAPVCLNSLLFQMERDLAEVERTLGEDAAAKAWDDRAKQRRKAVDKYLWDPAAGLYFDYNFELKRRRPYEFATTFWPLWVGLASDAQAARVRAALPRFEAPGGLLTSTTVSGNQWDAPFGWAPLQLPAVDGLRRYGFHDDADRIARKFLDLVAKEFEEHGTIVEKYDVQRRESDVSTGIRFGYSSNEVGFGWTNAAFVELLAGLQSRPARAAYAALPEISVFRCSRAGREPSAKCTP
jgi:alpha,alpha-trehalase